MTSPYSTAFGRGLAVWIDLSCVGMNGNFFTTSGSLYTASKVGELEVARVFDFCASGDDMNFKKSTAVPLFSAYFAMA